MARIRFSYRAASHWVLLAIAIAAISGVAKSSIAIVNSPVYMGDSVEVAYFGYENHTLVEVWIVSADDAIDYRGWGASGKKGALFFTACCAPPGEKFRLKVRGLPSMADSPAVAYTPYELSVEYVWYERPVSPSAKEMVGGRTFHDELSSDDIDFYASHERMSPRTTGPPSVSLFSRPKVLRVSHPATIEWTGFDGYQHVLLQISCPDGNQTTYRPSVERYYVWGIFDFVAQPNIGCRLFASAIILHDDYDPLAYPPRPLSEAYYDRVPGMGCSYEDTFAVLFDE